MARCLRLVAAVSGVVCRLVSPSVSLRLRLRLRLLRPTIQTMASQAPDDAFHGSLQQGMKDDWFTELSSMWPGQGMSFKVNEVVHTARSYFQVGAWERRKTRLA